LSFCEDLIFEMKRQPDSDVDDGQGTPSSKILVEEVTIGGPSPGNTATLDKVGVDLTQMALDGKLDVVYGRDNEIRMALRTLCRRRKNNPYLIGDPGVGKIAVAEAIAQVIATSYGSAATTTTTTEKDKKKRFEFPQLKNPFNKNKKEGNDDDDESTTITKKNPLLNLFIHHVLPLWLDIVLSVWNWLAWYLERATVEILKKRSKNYRRS